MFSKELKVGDRFLVSIGLVVVLTAIFAVFLIRYQMRQEALSDAESKARILLDRNLATHRYFTHKLRPAVFKLTENYLTPEYFNPTWMSSTYAVREIDKFFQELSKGNYYYKECAINARSPENEADELEKEIFPMIAADPEKIQWSGVRELQGKPYYVLLRRSETMKEACLRCHGDPKDAPKDLIKHYGPTRSFNRKVGELTSLASIRIPLSFAYAQTNKLAWKHIVGTAAILLLVFGVLTLLNRRLFLNPLKTIRESAVNISESKNLLGKQLPLEFQGEWNELAGALNEMSIQLKDHQDQLEDRINERTAELVKTNKKLIHAIKERKQSEETLRKSEESYRILVEAVDRSGQAIVINQDRNGVEAVCVFSNDTAVKMTGYSHEELSAVSWFDILHSRFRDATIQRYKKRLHGEDIPDLFELSIIRKDGTEIPIEVSSTKTKHQGDRALVTIFMDISDRRRAEEEKSRLGTQLQQAQKMESIGTLAGGIAHDFNNILSPIMIHSEMIMMDLPPESPLQQSAKQIYKGGERARDLVKQILTFARLRGDERAPIKISLILKEAIKLLRSTIPTTIDIRYKIETKQDTVLADPTQINQIVMNLCTNAAYAMREKGGEIELILAKEDIGIEYAEQFTELSPGHYLRLSVRDTGSGVDLDIMDRIFEPYFTTKGPGEGTGMGLALIHGIVKSYGGDITVESEPGKGTTFHVLLPIIEAEVSPIIEPKTEIPGGNERILFVDDERAAVDVIQSMLEKLGYKLTARTSSVEALEAFRNKPGGFDLVITDMTMPNMTGKDLAKEMMSIRPDIPIILCTGFSDQIDEKKAKAIGISAYVMKPIVMRQIANTIREVLDKK